MHISNTALLMLASISLTYAQRPADQVGTIRKLRIPKLEFTYTPPGQKAGPDLSLDKRELANRVMNGTPAAFNDYPFAVFLYVTVGNSGEACGGTLLAPNVVVTAAHCLIDEAQNLFNVSNYYISAGSVQNIQNNKNIYRPSKMIVSPAYDATRSVNDIGLIILSENIPSNIATPTKIYNENVYDNMPVVAAGWGVSSNDASATISSTLNYASLNISSSTPCSNLNANWKGNTNYSICTEVVNGKDTCYGDSGGPLVAVVPGLMPLVGLTSNGNAPGNFEKPPCGQQGGVAYYTNVNYFADWISKEANLPLSQLMYNTPSASSSKAVNTTAQDNSIDGSEPISAAPNVVASAISNPASNSTSSHLPSSSSGSNIRSNPYLLAPLLGLNSTTYFLFLLAIFFVAF